MTITIDLCQELSRSLPEHAWHYDASEQIIEPAPVGAGQTATDVNREASAVLLLLKRGSHSSAGSREDAATLESVLVKRLPIDDGLQVSNGAMDANIGSASSPPKRPAMLGSDLHFAAGKIAPT